MQGRSSELDSALRRLRSAGRTRIGACDRTALRQLYAAAFRWTYGRAGGRVNRVGRADARRLAATACLGELAAGAAPEEMRPVQALPQRRSVAPVFFRTSSERGSSVGSARRGSVTPLLRASMGGFASGRADLNLATNVIVLGVGQSSAVRRNELLRSSSSSARLREASVRESIRSVGTLIWRGGAGLHWRAASEGSMTEFGMTSAYGGQRTTAVVSLRDD